MLKINIFMAIYTYNKDIHKYNLTEKNFKHYKNIEEKHTIIWLKLESSFTNETIKNIATII